jgi:hypothetical protein
MGAASSYSNPSANITGTFYSFLVVSSIFISYTFLLTQAYYITRTFLSRASASFMSSSKSSSSSRTFQDKDPNEVDGDISIEASHPFYFSKFLEILFSQQKNILSMMTAHPYHFTICLTLE